MEQLTTIQTKNNLNNVFVDPEIGPGHGHHHYTVRQADTGAILLDIQFQKGPRTSPMSMHGVLDSDLLEIVYDRLKMFQEGEFATLENERALYHINEALMWLAKRANQRAARGVLGTNEK